MSLQEINKEEFDSFANQVKNRSFEQSVQMGNLRKKRGYDVTYLGLKDNSNIKVASLVYCQKILGGKRMEIYYGPIYLEKSYLTEFLTQLKVYAKQRNVLELSIFPNDDYQIFDTHGSPTSKENKELLELFKSNGYLHSGFHVGYHDGQVYWHYLKNLEGLTSESLRKSFSKKGRPLANKTSTFGINIRKLKRDELYLFKKITSSTSERREYSDKSLEYYELFYDSFGDSCEFVVASLNFEKYLQNLEVDAKKILNELTELNYKIAGGINSAKINKRKKELEKQWDTFKIRIDEAKDMIVTYGSEEVILAGSLFIYTPQESVYLFSGSYTEFNKFYAPVILQEYVMLESLKRGIDTYNFLGIQGNFDGTDGVLRFKQNFNGYITQKMGLFRYYPKPFKYKCYQLLKTILRRG